MSQLSDQYLIFLNRQGIIPGSKEDEEAFIERANLCLQSNGIIEEFLNKELPFDKKDLSSIPIIDSATSEIREAYDIEPLWVPLFFSDKKLLPWQGGCTWILQKEEMSPPLTVIQLRKIFKKKERYLGLYSKSELLIHEWVHAGRSAFNEPRFEEIFAYRLSPSPLRRLLGPLIQKPYEVILFMTTFPLAFLFPEFFGLVIILLMTYAFGRLWINQRLFYHCFNNLKKITHNHKTAQAILFRLTDKEIKEFNYLTREQILSYMNKEPSLRWKVIRLAYNP